MPPGRQDDGLVAARTIREELPDVAVLVLSQHLVERYATELLGDRPRGVGYLLKQRVADADAFADAVLRVAGGGLVLDPEVVARMTGRRRTADPLEDLTDRERDVLQLMVQGRSNLGIAQALGIGVPAVEKHVTRIFGKLDLPPEPTEHRRVLAVLSLLRAQTGSRP
jgi:DNA-binding NarL/FixJ family response regulator